MAKTNMTAQEIKEQSARLAQVGQQKVDGLVWIVTTDGKKTQNFINVHNRNRLEIVHDFMRAFDMDAQTIGMAAAMVEFHDAVETKAKSKAPRRPKAKK